MERRRRECEENVKKMVTERLVKVSMDNIPAAR